MCTFGGSRADIVLCGGKVLRDGICLLVVRQVYNLRPRYDCCGIDIIHVLGELIEQARNVRGW